MSELRARPPADDWREDAIECDDVRFSRADRLANAVLQDTEEGA